MTRRRDRRSPAPAPGWPGCSRLRPGPGRTRQPGGAGRRGARQEGFVLLLTLGLLVLCSVVAASYLSLAAAQRERAAKLLLQERGVQGFEAGTLGGLRSSVLHSLSHQGGFLWPDAFAAQQSTAAPPAGEPGTVSLVNPYHVESTEFTSWSPGPPGEAPSGGPRRYRPVFTDPTRYFRAAQGPSSSQDYHPLGGADDPEAWSRADDPLRGTRALVNAFGLRAQLGLGGGGLLPNGPDAGHRERPAPVLEVAYALEVRQLPVSEFGYYAGSGKPARLDAAQFTAGDCGRAYALGGFLYRGHVRSDYPVATAQNIAPAAPDKPHSLTVHERPGSARAYRLTGSTAEAGWPAVAKVQAQSLVNTGGVTPMGIAPAADLTFLTAPPNAPLPAAAGPAPGADAVGALRAQQLYQRCDSLVYLRTDGALFVSDGPTRHQSPDQSAFTLRPTADGSTSPAHPVLEFNYGRAVDTGATARSYYVYADDPQATVLVTAAHHLAGPLSIVSPHPIYVEGGFNDGDDPQPASLVTPGRVGVVPTGWHPN